MTNNTNMKQFEEYELRDATVPEARHMGRCLKTVYQAQHEFYEKHGYFTRSMKKLGVGKRCEGVALKVEPGPKYFTATGVMNREADFTTVKWSVDESGKIKRHSFFDFPF